VDTSWFKAYVDERDEHHKEARGLMDSVATKELAVKNLITSDYVMDESITLIRLAHSHSKAAEFARTTINSRLVRIVYMGEEVFLESVDLFERSKDKEWSFTDCTSFTLMKKTGLSQAFTFDPHFQQAGFHTLPR
jgi:predicted nucleic acid-binding protein